MAHSVDEDSESEIAPGFGAMVLTPETLSEPANKHVSLLAQWNDYFQQGTLQDFQRLCADLGLPSDLPSKTKCREVSSQMPETKVRNADNILDTQEHQRQYQAVPAM